MQVFITFWQISEDYFVQGSFLFGELSNSFLSVIMLELLVLVAFPSIWLHTRGLYCTAQQW